MADTKISALPASTTPLAGTEVLPIVQSGATKQVSVANLTAGRALSATELTLTTGNLIVSDGKGIDFSATPGTGTSELFADYEEGTFTPVVIGPTAGTATYSTQVGKYTKIGNVVNILIDLTWTGGTGSGAFLAVTGLPFTIGGSNTALAGYTTDIALSANNFAIYLANVSSTTIYIQEAPTGGGARANINYDSAGSVTISGTYFV
ncbi:hypothetical protein [Phage DSL-LC05]|nr:hypothetical protein [Phage DSL-LC05]